MSTNRKSEKPKRRKGLSACPLVELPAWTIGEAKDGADLVAAFALADLEGQWIHLGAKSQRAALGFPVFGKCTICLDEGRFRINHSSVGGGYQNEATPAEVTAAARAGKKP